MPFKASVDLVTTGFGPQCQDFGDGVASPILEGTGNATHLGKVTVIAIHCYFSPDSYEPYTIQNGASTFEAANGDLLKFTYEGTWAPNPPNQVIMDLTFQINGGTGRFSDAVGSGDMNFVAAFPQLPPLPGDIAEITVDYLGTISY